MSEAIKAPVVSATPAIVSSTPAAITRRTGMSRSKLATWGPPLAVFALLMGVWYLLTYVVLEPDKRFLLPAPHEVLIEGILNPPVVVDILQALGLTALVALTGLVIAIVIGVGWGIAMSQARWIENSTFPYAVILQCIPILALVPLIGFWFGYDFLARTIVCVMISLFPMVSNTLFGLQSVDVGQRELFQLQKASRLTMLTKLQLPTALPAIFAGLRISAGLSVVGAIVGDFFFRRGTPGLGSLISVYQSRLLASELFTAILAAALFGVLVFWLFGVLRRLAVGRWYDTSNS